MIEPTVGRVVWLRNPNNRALACDGKQPLCALVAYVHSSRMVNLAGFDSNGVMFTATSVTLVQDGDAVPAGQYCEWMPYQKGQAAKHDALEAKIKGA